jgi:uncharacterized repeat protein (TIGR04052 family)
MRASAIRLAELAPMVDFCDTLSNTCAEALARSFFAAMLARYLLLLLMVSACSAPQQTIEIPFVPRFGEQPISCGTDATGIALTDLRFYVHDLRLLDMDGTDTPATMLEDPLWQSNAVALLDFEDGAGACINGTQQTNTVIRAQVPEGEYAGIRFRIGVPEALNHADPLRAQAPLNYSVMHWHWRTGYKFLRAGVANDQDGFWIHLGSSRCKGTSSDVSSCSAPNRPLVELPAFEPGEDAVEVDLQQLVREIDLGDGSPTDCSSGPAESACEMPFKALGLDFATGANGHAAAVFRRRPRE